MVPASFYGDALHIQVTDYTVTIGFGQQGSPTPDVVVKVPPVVAKHLAMLLRRHLKDYERKLGGLEVPTALLEKMGVAPEDW